VKIAAESGVLLSPPFTPFAPTQDVVRFQDEKQLVGKLLGMNLAISTIPGMLWFSMNPKPHPCVNDTERSLAGLI
jgi:hypothetical protein